MKDKMDKTEKNKPKPIFIKIADEIRNTILNIINNNAELGAAIVIPAWDYGHEDAPAAIFIVKDENLNLPRSMKLLDNLHLNLSSIQQNLIEKLVKHIQEQEETIKTLKDRVAAMKENKEDNG
jgi:hypothetical protein